MVKCRLTAALALYNIALINRRKINQYYYYIACTGYQVDTMKIN